MPKLKPSWVITDIPKNTKIKLWRLMKDNPTYKSWEKAIVGKSHTTDQDKIFTNVELDYIRMSKDTYNCLKKEVMLMPLEELETLPQDLQRWIYDMRPDLKAEKDKGIIAQPQREVSKVTQIEQGPYQETPHKKKMRELAGKLIGEISLPWIMDSFIVELKSGRFFPDRNGFLTSVAENGTISIELSIEGKGEIGHLYEGLRSHLKTGGFSQVLDEIGNWRQGVADNLVKCHRFFTLVKKKLEKSYSVSIPMKDKGQIGFTMWFPITTCGDAIEQARGVPYITDSWYKYEGLDLRCGAFLIYKGIPDEDLDVYKNAHVALRVKYAAHEQAREIAKQRGSIYQIEDKIRQQLQKFIDMEHLPGHCELCSHSPL